MTNKLKFSKLNIAVVLVLLSVLGGFISYRLYFKKAKNQLQLPILTYHHIQKIDAKTTTKLEFDLNISPEIFGKQMEYLKLHNYTPILSQDLADLVIHKTRVLPQKPIIITIDDGFKDNIENALPILQNFQFKANFEIPVLAIGKPEYMTWEDLKILKSAGMGLDSHTLNHCSLAPFNPNKFTQIFQPFLANPIVTNENRVIDETGCPGFGAETVLTMEQVKAELVQSKSLLEKQLDIQVNTIAYPFGSYNPQTLAITQAAGYQLGYTTKQQAGDFQIDLDKPLELRRYHVFGQQEVYLNGFFALED